MSQEKSPQITRHSDPARPWYRYVRLLLPRPASGAAIPEGTSGRWVDLGCGFGELMSDSSARGRAPIGLDLDRRALIEAKDAGFVVVAADLARGMPFRSGGLEGATLIEVIEHVFETESLLAELARVIRPGGWVIMTTPNVAHFSYRIRALTGHAPKQEGYHVRFFTRSRLVRLLEANGFRIEARASYGKQALLTKLARIRRMRGSSSEGGDRKIRYRVPALLEPLLAQRFVWRLRRESSQSA